MAPLAAVESDIYVSPIAKALLSDCRLKLMASPPERCHIRVRDPGHTLPRPLSSAQKKTTAEAIVFSFLIQPALISRNLSRKDPSGILRILSLVIFKDHLLTFKLAQYFNLTGDV